jgi:hypothetical protein
MKLEESASGQKSEVSRWENPHWRQAVYISMKNWGKKGETKGQSQKMINRQRVSNQGGRFGLFRAQKLTIARVNKLTRSGIKSKAVIHSNLAKTEKEIAALCRLPGASSLPHLVACRTVGVLGGSKLSGDEADLLEVSNVRFGDTRELQGIGEWYL